MATQRKPKSGWSFKGAAQDLAGVRSIKRVIGAGKFHVLRHRTEPRTVMVRGKRLRLKGGLYYHVYRE